MTYSLVNLGESLGRLADELERQVMLDQETITARDTDIHRREWQMTKLTPLNDKVIGRMLETVGLVRTSAGGVILGADEAGKDDFVRPRWFEVTHVGPDQQDVAVGDYVLLPHGRWGHGFNLEGSIREEDKLFHIDTDSMMAVSDDNPIK